MTSERQQVTCDLVTVYQGPDETTARIVIALLESEGISAALQAMVPSTGDVASASNWCEVAVAAEDAERSIELIEAYEPDEPYGPTRKTWAEQYTHVYPRMPFMAVALFALAAACTTWSSDSSAEVCAVLIPGLAFVAYGFVNGSLQKHVPSQFAQAHALATTGLFASAALFGAVLAARVSGMMASDGTATCAYLTIAAAAILTATYDIILGKQEN